MSVTWLKSMRVLLQPMKFFKLPLVTIYGTTYKKLLWYRLVQLFPVLLTQPQSSDPRNTQSTYKPPKKLYQAVPFKYYYKNILYKGI